ncbi:glucosaminidase domain-containing protein [Hippea jasoniae]|uniref:glucosaminidase domain-containing protein n=1 Tax=Hippea jasoniae TaxID=944479 RepID=UPI000558C498|nr:glucosaminidase domain-containing protein [Hippea jasoniae]
MSKKRLVVRPSSNRIGVVLLILFALAFLAGILLLAKQVLAKELIKPNIEFYTAGNVKQLKQKLYIYSVINDYTLSFRPHLLKSLPEDFKKLPPKTRKELFIKVMLPIAAAANLKFYRLHSIFVNIEKKILDGEKLTETEIKLLNYGYEKFKCNTISELIKRCNGVPISLLIAQAGIESGWGSSRFAIDFNNIYGIHRKKIVKGKPIVQVYKNLYQATEAYIMNLNISPAYRRFREARARMGLKANPYKLAEYLSLYSIKRYQYVRLIQRVITANNLTAHDDYFLGSIVAESGKVAGDLD